MGESFRPLRLLIVCSCIAMVGLGCVKPQTPRQAPATSIAITDVGAVAGKWEGLVSAKRQDDWLMVKIDTDGSYEAKSSRGFVGVFEAKGTLELSEGILSSRPDKGGATFSLHEREGKQFLKFVGITGRGIKHTGELYRVK